jgi:hypothetical protein
MRPGSERPKSAQRLLALMLCIAKVPARDACFATYPGVRWARVRTLACRALRKRAVTRGRRRRWRAKPGQAGPVNVPGLLGVAVNSGLRSEDAFLSAARTPSASRSVA